MMNLEGRKTGTERNRENEDMKLTREQIRIHAFAQRKARQIFTPGDWLTVRRCGGTTARFKFTGFAAQCFSKSFGPYVACSAHLDHPIDILKINGSPIDMAAEASALQDLWWETFADQFARQNGFMPSPGDSLTETYFEWFCRGLDCDPKPGDCPF